MTRYALHEKASAGCAIAATMIALVAGCDATEGPLLEHVPSRDAGSHADGGPASPGSAVRPGMSLQYQITGTLDTSVDAQLFVVDLFDASTQEVAALHARGRTVIAYVSVGSFEPWREDAASFPKSTIGMALADYPDESWLDIRSPDVRSAITARFDRARQKGFDGVFASAVGAYAADSGFLLTRSDQLGYDQFLADAARTRRLSVGLSGDFELGSEVADAFDWALAIGCIAASSCDSLAPFEQLHKAVFDLETQGDPSAVCTQAASYAVPTTLKHDAFDAWRMPCS